MNPLCVLLPIFALGADPAPTVAELAAGVRQHQDLYSNLSFSYDVRSQLTPALPIGSAAVKPPAGPVVHSRDRLRLLSSPQAAAAFPIYVWERHVLDRQGRTVLDQMDGFDGLYGRRFSSHDSAGRPRGNGQVFPFPPPEQNVNLFEQFLYNDLNGISRRLDPDGKVSRQIDNQFRIVSTGTFQNFTTYHLEGGSQQFGLVYRVSVTGPPDFLVIRYQALDHKDQRLYVSLEVTDVKQFGQTRYPAAGEYYQRPVNNSPGMTYRFQVAAVESLSPKALEDWFPAWPKGALILDHVSNRTYSIPDEAQDRNWRQIAGRTLSSADPSVANENRKTFFIVLTQLVLFFSVGLYLWRQSRRRRPSA